MGSEIENMRKEKEEMLDWAKSSLHLILCSFIALVIKLYFEKKIFDFVAWGQFLSMVGAILIFMETILGPQKKQLIKMFDEYMENSAREKENIEDIEKVYEAALAISKFKALKVITNIFRSIFKDLSTVSLYATTITFVHEGNVFGIILFFVGYVLQLNIIFIHN